MRGTLYYYFFNEESAKQVIVSLEITAETSIVISGNKQIAISLSISASSSITIEAKKSVSYSPSLDLVSGILTLVGSKSIRGSPTLTGTLTTTITSRKGSFSSFSLNGTCSATVSGLKKALASIILNGAGNINVTGLNNTPAGGNVYLELTATITCSGKKITGSNPSQNISSAITILSLKSFIQTLDIALNSSSVVLTKKSIDVLLVINNILIIDVIGKRFTGSPYKEILVFSSNIVSKMEVTAAVNSKVTLISVLDQITEVKDD